jgi:hypothetical protein
MNFAGDEFFVNQLSERDGEYHLAPATAEQLKDDQVSELYDRANRQLRGHLRELQSVNTRLTTSSPGTNETDRLLRRRREASENVNQVVLHLETQLVRHCRARGQIPTHLEKPRLVPAGTQRVAA